MKSDAVYLNQMLESATKIESFTAGLDKETFSKDQKTQSAVIMQLMLIGEVSKKVSAPTKASINLPWKDITGFRDRAIHDYFEVDLDVVWNTVASDLPILDKELTRFISH